MGGEGTRLQLQLTKVPLYSCLVYTGSLVARPLVGAPGPGWYSIYLGARDGVPNKERISTRRECSSKNKRLRRDWALSSKNSKSIEVGLPRDVGPWRPWQFFKDPEFEGASADTGKLRTRALTWVKGH